MSQHILMHIEHKPENKILHYADGTIEVRTLNWVLLETKQLGHEVTMLDMEDQFNLIYEDATSKEKAKLLRKKAKEEAQAQGDFKKLQALEESENEASDDDPYMEGEPLEAGGSETFSPGSEGEISDFEALPRRKEDYEAEETEDDEELSA